MIARHWKGIAKPEKADVYIGHLVHETFPELRKITGFIHASILKRSVPEGIEFLVITTWDSLDPIRKFAGEDLNKAVVPVIAQQMMVRFNEDVLHYDVALQFDPDR